MQYTQYADKRQQQQQQAEAAAANWQTDSQRAEQTGIGIERDRDRHMVVQERGCAALLSHCSVTSDKKEERERNTQRGDRMRAVPICINLHFNHFYVGLTQQTNPLPPPSLGVTSKHRTGATYCISCKWQQRQRRHSIPISGIPIKMKL